MCNCTILNTLFGQGGGRAVRLVMVVGVVRVDRVVWVVGMDGMIRVVKVFAVVRAVGVVGVVKVVRTVGAFQLGSKGLGVELPGQLSILLNKIIEKSSC